MKITTDFIKQNKFSVIIISLLVLVMITFSMMGNILAKYRVNGDSTDVARVAKFDITESGISEMAITSDKFYPGYTLVQPIEINNKSEVAIDYTLTVEILTDNLPIVLNMNEQEGKKIVITKKLQPNSGEEVYNLNIKWPESENDYSYSMMVDAVKLSVTAVQID